MGYIVAVATGLGLMLSAETLILMGHGAGAAGVWFLLFAMAAAGLHLLGAIRLYGNFGELPGFQGEMLLVQKAWGRPATRVFPLAARLSVALMAATSLLATAGYVFNEVFVYWFPNFLFATLLLVLIMAVGMAGGSVWAGFQVLAVGTAVVGLTVLIIAGLYASPPPMNAAPATMETKPWLGAALAALLLPIGYDLAHFANRPGSNQGGRAPAAAVVIGVLLLIVWGAVSLRWVAPSTLAETTIPYTIAARTIMGQHGRIIMGIVILAGACAAVNALFGGVAQAIAAMKPTNPPSTAQAGAGRSGERVVILALGGATAVLLFGGLAGYAELKTFLRGGLILWLLHYAILHLAAWRTTPGKHQWSGRTPHAAGALLSGLAAAGLLIFDQRTGLAAIFMLAVLAAVLCTTLLMEMLARKRYSGR